MIEHDDHYEFPLQGAIIGRIIFDYRTWLVTEESDDELQFIFAGPFSFGHAGTSTTFDPEFPETLAPILTLLRQPLATARAYKDGHMEIDFVDGRRIVAPLADSYEAWELTGHNRLNIVSLPGGTVAEWLPQPEAND